MSKVLTYHKQSNGEHWFTHGPYQKKEIEAIQDPERGNTGKAPTSIPSPFAQIDLVKTAFNNVKDNPQLEGTNIDFKLISHCLDVGELFFNRDAFGDKLQIIAWDKVADLNKLLHSSNEKHKRFGEAIKLYLDQDAKAYNFNDFRRLFFIMINFRLVGGTSPSTLFFASSNDLSFVDAKMPNNHTLLGNKHLHLYDREEDFQLYIYALREAMPEFGSKFRELNEYLNKCERVIEREKPELYTKIKKLTRDSYKKSFDPLDTGIANDLVSVLNFPLRKRKSSDGAEESDFEIKAKKPIQGRKPLVLQRGHGGLSTSTGKPMIYYNYPLTKEITENIPYQNSEPNLNERFLPGLTGIKYPHLVADDFLEPYLIKLVYPIHKQKYFDGNFSGIDDDGRGYLVPIKRKFFEYFTIQDLREGTLENGLPFFEMKGMAGGAVNVFLRIPVKTGYITFERMYYINPNNPSTPQPPEPKNNKGSILECRFGTTIFPFIQIPDPEIPKHYRVLLVDQDILPETKGFKYNLKFYSEMDNKEVPIQANVSRNKKNSNQPKISINTYVLEENFDYIRIDNGQQAGGLIIPNFIITGNGNVTFYFAIDFGTTNTHVEYKVGRSGSPKPFEISEKDVQIGTLHEPYKEDRFKYLKNEFLEEIVVVPLDIFPERLGKEYDYSFPQRTVLAQSADLDFGKATYTLADFNIPFIYEKKDIPNYTKIETDLKWSNYTNNEQSKRRVKAFFEKLLFMIRAKVLLNSGNLNDVKMTWFYPSSMMEARVNQLEELWNKLYKVYVSNQNSPQKLSESIAPFYFYKDALGVNAASKPVVAIDIGGGTSDVVIYEKNKPVILTSFKYAANAIFGDGFSKYGAVGRNGFVTKYESKIKDLLDTNNQNTLLNVLTAIQDYRKSIDIIAFFFSLENNKKIKEKKLPISFSQALKDDDKMRIVFIIFYVSILYHIGSLMKRKGLSKPRYLTFSGNGSRVLQYITPNDNTLETLSKTVFDKIYEDTAPYNLEIRRELEGPKESTCKGGLMIDEEFSFEDIENIKTIYLGVEAHPFVNSQPRYNELEENDKILKEVAEDYKRFTDMFFQINNQLNFNAKFDVHMNTIPLARKVLGMDTMMYLKTGIEQKKKEMTNPNVPIEEPLFFYPLKGALNRLAFEIAGLDQ
jgi:hypothetical protein